MMCGKDTISERIEQYRTTSVSQTQLTAQESTLTSLKSERDELAEEKTDLEGKLTVLQSQTHELQVRRCMVMVTVGGLLGLIWLTLIDRLS